MTPPIHSAAAGTDPETTRAKPPRWPPPSRLNHPHRRVTRQDHSHRTRPPPQRPDTRHPPHTQREEDDHTRGTPKDRLHDNTRAPNRAQNQNDYPRDDPTQTPPRRKKQDNPHYHGDRLKITSHDDNHKPKHKETPQTTPKRHTHMNPILPTLQKN